MVVIKKRGGRRDDVCPSLFLLLPFIINYIKNALNIIDV